MNNINTLRTVLFDTLAGLQNKKDPMDIDRASAICEVSREIVSTAKLEIDYEKVTGHSSGGSFINGGTSQIENNQTKRPANATANGSKRIEHVPGGTVTTHRMR